MPHGSTVVARCVTRRGVGGPRGRITTGGVSGSGDSLPVAGWAMTAVHLTAAQARALGVDTPVKAKTTRKVAAGPYWSRCKSCAVEFTSYASEDRHVKEFHHARYDTLEEAS